MATKTSQRKIDEARYAIDLVNQQVLSMMQNHNITAQGMVIALVTNAAYLFTNGSFAKGEPQDVRDYSFKQVLTIFMHARRRAEREVAQALGVVVDRLRKG